MYDAGAALANAPPDQSFPGGGTSAGENPSRNVTDEAALVKRAMDAAGSDTNWHLSQICAAPDMVYDADNDVLNHHPNLQDPRQGKFAWSFDDSLGAGQTVYVIEGGNLLGHGVSAVVGSLLLRFNYLKTLTESTRKFRTPSEENSTNPHGAQHGTPPRMKTSTGSWSPVISWARPSVWRETPMWSWCNIGPTDVRNSYSASPLWEP